jgi:hypothetical protein
MMTVQELIDHLSKFDPNLEVWVSEQAIRYMPADEPTLDMYRDALTHDASVVHPDDLTLEEYLIENCWDGDDPEQIEESTREYKEWLKTLVERVTIWGAW